MPGAVGQSLYHAAFDLGPCVAPHPSTMAAALLAYDATVATDQRERALDRRTARRRQQRCADNALKPGEIIQNIELPRPLDGERALYKRAISRTYAEWPLAGVCARAVVKDGTFQFIRLAAGGIAPVPLRLAASEAALQGKPANARNDCGSGPACNLGRKAVADDGLQARSFERLVRDCWKSWRSRFRRVG